MNRFSSIITPFIAAGFSCCILLFLTTACNSLNPDIEPFEGEQRPVLECYLEPGKPIRLTLSQSEGFFAEFDTSRAYWEQVSLINDAQVIVSGDGFSDTLVQQIIFEPLTNRVFNYAATRIIPSDVGAEYSLEVNLSNGKKIEGYSKMLDVVEIDSMSYSFSDDIDKLARALTYFRDPVTTQDFYQYVLRYDRRYDTLPRQNLPFPDEFFGTENIALVGTYDLRRNQKAIATLIHINEDYHDFLRSTTLAIAGSQNPVILPSKIKSNVHGSAEPIGIFTTLALARDTITIK